MQAHACLNKTKANQEKNRRKSKGYEKERAESIRNLASMSFI